MAGETYTAKTYSMDEPSLIKLAELEKMMDRNASWILRRALSLYDPMLDQGVIGPRIVAVKHADGKIETAPDF